MPHYSRPQSSLALIAIILLTSHCGGGSSDSGTPPPTTAIGKTATNNGDAQNGTVGQPLGSPLQVLVTETGTPSAGVTVSWSTGSGGSVVPSGVTDANGIATAAWTLGTASGAQTAQAALSGAAGSPVTFTATAAPGPVAALTKAGGDGQTGNINATLAAPVQAKVEDQFGNGVPNVDVSWNAVGGAVSAGTVPSGAGGISQVQVTLGAAPGDVTITAAAAGLAPVTFTATAQVPAPIPTTATVRVGNIFFASNHNPSQNPAVDTVAVGGTVTWTWVSDGEHSVQSLGSPPFTSSDFMSAAGDSYAFTFTTAGTYQYDCGVHGPLMTGRIVVR